MISYHGKLAVSIVRVLNLFDQLGFQHFFVWIIMFRLNLWTNMTFEGMEARYIIWIISFKIHVSTHILKQNHSIEPPLHKEHMRVHHLFHKISTICLRHGHTGKCTTPSIMME